MIALASALLVAAAGHDYEAKLISWAAAQHGRVLAPAPRGRRIEELLFSSEEVFAEGDLWPTRWNKVHWKTHENVAARELLLRAGDVWDDERVLETERIMRGLLLWSVVRIVAVEGREGGVAMLVVTQDRWSLRLNSQYYVVGDLLEYLRLQPSEWNVFGYGKQAAFELQLQLDALLVSESFVDPRLLGTRFRLAETLGLVVNRSTGQLEGSTGSLELSRPLVALSDRWAYGLTLSGSSRPVRRFRGRDLWLLDSPWGPVPYVYRAELGDLEGTFTWRLGEALKLSVQAGLKGYTRQYEAPGELDPAAARWLEASWAPLSESALGLVVRAEAFENHFVVMEDVESIGLSEDVQLGPRVWAGALWAAPLPFTSARHVEAAVSARWRFALGDGLLTLQAAAFARFTGAGLPVNRRGAFELVLLSPHVGGARLVARVAGDLRQADLTNTRVLLGGANGLRGAPPELQAGRNWLLANLELRTSAVPFGSARIGTAMFYDAGSAFDDRPWLTHTLGAGLRVLFPQFGPEVMRIDLGVVVGGQGFPAAMLSFSNLSSSFGQITDFRPAQLFEAPL